VWKSRFLPFADGTQKRYEIRLLLYVRYKFVLRLSDRRNNRFAQITVAAFRTRTREFVDRRFNRSPVVYAVTRDRATCARIRIPDTRYLVAVIVVVITVIDCALVAGSDARRVRPGGLTSKTD